MVTMVVLTNVNESICENSRQSPFYAAGVADSNLYRIKVECDRYGIRLISENEFKKSGYPQDASHFGNTLFFLHYSLPYFDYIKEYPDATHIYVAMEPDVVFPYDNASGIHNILRVFDYCVTLYESIANQEQYAFYVPDIYNFDVIFHNSNDINHRKYLAALINSDKYSWHKNELYSERKKIINFFESKDPKVFRFYGNWGKRMQNYESYGGMVTCKLAALSNATFTFCLENACGSSGYMTEKIFDAMFADTIPVYWGFEEIDRYVPVDCYIDYRQFNNIAECKHYLEKMRGDEKLKYINNIHEWLATGDKSGLSCSSFVDAVAALVQKGKRRKANRIACDMVMTLQSLKSIPPRTIRKIKEINGKL